MVTAEVSEKTIRLDLGGALADSLRNLSGVNETVIDIHSVIDKNTGKISAIGKEVARGTLNNLLDQGLAISDINKALKQEFAKLMIENPHARLELRKIENSIRFGLTWHAAKSIVGNSQVIGNYSRSSGQSYLGYAYEVARHAIKDTDNVGKSALLFSAAESRIESSFDDAIRLRTQQLARQNNDILAPTDNEDPVSQETTSTLSEMMNRFKISLRDGSESSKQGNIHGLRTKRRALAIVGTGVFLAALVFLPRIATLRGLPIFDYLNSSPLARQPIEVQIPEGYQLEKFEEMLQDVVIDAEEQGSLENISEPIAETVVTDNSEIVANEGSKADNGVQDSVNAIVAETQTTQDPSSDNTNTLPNPGKEPMIQVNFAQSMAIEDNIPFVSQEDLEAQKIAKLKVNEAVSDLESIGFETEINGDLITARFYTPLPRESSENYQGKDLNMNVGVQIFNENAPEKWEPGVIYGLVDNKMVNVWDLRHVMATYIKDGVPVSLKASGVCAIPSALGAVQDEINRMARSSGEIPQIVTFVDGNANNNNQPHSATYASYTPVDQRGNRSDWEAGYTIVQYTRDGVSVGDPEYYSGVDEKFRSYWEGRGFEVSVRFELGYYEKGNTIPVPSYQDDIDFTNTMLSFGKPTIVAVAVINLKPIPNWESSQTANVEFDSLDVAGNPNPDFTTDTTSTELQVAYGQLVQIEP